MTASSLCPFPQRLHRRRLTVCFSGGVGLVQAAGLGGGLAGGDFRAGGDDVKSGVEGGAVTGRGLCHAATILQRRVENHVR
jgi:hypothetical protein